MTITTKSKSKYLGYLFLLFCGPIAHASVVISEIHYDPSGTDTKREWIEICNTGSASIDVSGYKLFENSTNHAFTINTGSGTLAMNECAVVADDAKTFSSDYSSFTGMLFDSAFSLSNSGESLILRDTGGADIDGVSYTSSLGGNGDGNSLHRSGSTFTSGTPSPGTESGLVAQTGTPVDTTSTTSTPQPTSTTTVFHTVTIEPPPQLFLRVPKILSATINTVTHFVAESYNAKGAVVQPSISWAFGDGTSGAGISAAHIYKYPGEYIVSVIATTTDGLRAEEEIVVSVTENMLSAYIGSGGDQLIIENNAGTPADLTGYVLLSGGYTFRFPDKTKILPQKKIILATDTTGLKEVKRSRYIELRAPDGTVVASDTLKEIQIAPGALLPSRMGELFTVGKFGIAEASSTEVSTQKTHAVAAAATVTAMQKTTPIVAASQSHNSVQKQAPQHVGAAQEEKEVRTPVIENIPPQTSQIAAVDGVQTEETSPMYYYLLLLLGLTLVVGIPFASSLLFSEPITEKMTLENAILSEAGEYTIIDTQKK